MIDVAALKARVQEVRARIEAAVTTEAGHGDTGREWGLAVGRELARAYDELLAPVFAIVEREPVALAAVGGYGRGALALRSDLDLRILARRAADAERASEKLLYPLWDAGIAVGHQTIVLGEVLDLAREDVSTATSLLDWRHVAGDRALSDELVWRASGSLFSTTGLARFGQQLATEVHRRHERFGGSVYLLEPDVKNGAGGLRDADVFRWAGAARYGTGELDGLLRVGAIVPREAAEIASAQDRLWRIRHLLHKLAGRRSDRLTFDAQEIVASELGYGSGLERREGGADGTEAVERMMSEYYRAARGMERALDMMLTRATHVPDKRRPKDGDLGDGFRLFDGAITLDDTARLEAEPSLALRLVAVAVEKNRPIYPFARDAVSRLTGDAAFCERLRVDPTARRLFIDLVSLRRETSLRQGSALREMHDLGLVLAMIPEFSPVVGRVHHDVYHVYTVDVHSVAAVDRLAALARGELATEHPLASRLAAEVANHAVLAFAALLHDVGKAIGGKDHSERGATMCRVILERLGLRSSDIDEIAMLIREHLTMYRLATRRDVDDPATVSELAAAVRSREALQNLFLLTVVDVSTTSPTSMTSWKAHMLDELYVACDQHLSGGAGEQGRADSLRDQILAFANEYVRGEPASAVELAYLPSFVASMPDRYLLASSAQAVVAHASVARRHDERSATVSLESVPSSHPDALEVCVVASDRPGLLAAIAAALAGARLEVLAAQVYLRRLPGGAASAVDLFWVVSRVDSLSAASKALPKSSAISPRFLAGATTASAVARVPAVPRRAGPRVPTRVLLDHRASREHTVIEVTTLDRPGVLFAITNALFELGLDIAVAKINTEGTRVADVFYVSERDGTKLDSGSRSRAVEAAVLAALGEDASQGLEDTRVKA
ncbi:MAG: [protein-PII] uridylyltransferase [Polyangiaceae bacterium]